MSAQTADLTLPHPYLLFLGDTTERGYAKTALGLRDWAGDKCVGEFVLDGAAVSTGLPQMTPSEAVALGARAMVIGVANSGGVIPPNWRASLIEALRAGLDIISGMHQRLTDIPGLAETAAECGRRLIDVRNPPPSIPTGTGRKRTGKRLLTVGTDCALGKKYAALALARAFAEKGVAAEFRATGQTGIMIAGGGIPMDAVIADFAAGAAEILSPDAAADHWDVIEGQGSILHPAYGGVSLSLLHGSQPDVFVVCHEPGRTHVLGVPGYELPSIQDIIEATVLLGRRTNPAIRCGGVAYNTHALKPDEAARLMALDSQRLRLPVADPMRGGPAFDRLVESCLE
ncbi:MULTISPECIES: DUF1611 domain-containing protein [Alphaproteobacteria]|jgi:uncharacterized NAD-dependent epimerase/dehydratase family protein|uniref:DUF1611 domain-containing protein n=1 Tax=Alphaproteobacteria TaxID=28211 RepID=UPI000A52ACD9|nr:MULTISPECIES: DUF1611 domain-containing protein [Alphaproteobacteria]WCP11654.1 hypothetical protein sphantq_00033 [Sphingobium sp. AntQ-1]